MITRMRTWLLIIISVLLWINPASGQWGGKRKDTCPKPELNNGSVKLRSSGRVVKYNCLKGYLAVGETIATCIRGKWSSEPPVCAARGCDDLSPPESGRFVKGFAGAVLLAECNPGYVLYGSRMIFCDGAVWNDTTPTCKASDKKASLSCSFETEDLCGWIQDPLHNFDWKRQNMETPSRIVDTGPSFDHTLGEGKEGYYLYIESSSPRVENDTARLYSPVYGPEMAKEACFVLWYHMYGSGTGSLLVYIKPESKNLQEIEPSFRKSGNQGNYWRQGYVSLPNIEENFQIVIEGVRGSSYASDIAIDDVMLGQGYQCQVAVNQSTDIPGVPPTKPSEKPEMRNTSCFSRCGTSSPPTMCSCDSDCLLNATCCLDYTEFCLADGALPSIYGPSRINPEEIKSGDMKPGVNVVVVIGIIVGLLGATALLTGVVVTVLRWRNKKPTRVKKQERLPEDSDVRYLRPDDDIQLDLTEATPSQFSNFEQL